EPGPCEATWGLTERNRKARFYRLSAAGRRQLASEGSRWSRYTEGGGQVLDAEVAFFTQVLERLRALPGVSEVGFISDVLFSKRRESTPFFLPTQLNGPAGSEQG